MTIFQRKNKLLTLVMLLFLINPSFSQNDLNRVVTELPDSIHGDSIILVVYDGPAGGLRKVLTKNIKRAYKGTFLVVQKKSGLDEYYENYRYILRIASEEYSNTAVFYNPNPIGTNSKWSYSTILDIKLKFTDCLRKIDYFFEGKDTQYGEHVIFRLFKELETKRIGTADFESVNDFLLNGDSKDSISVTSIVQVVVKTMNNRIKNTKLFHTELVSPQLQKTIENEYKKDILNKSEVLVNEYIKNRRKLLKDKVKRSSLIIEERSYKNKKNVMHVLVTVKIPATSINS